MALSLGKNIEKKEWIKYFVLPDNEVKLYII